MLVENTPFHLGELAAQKRAGAGDIAVRAAPFIRDHMPDQHRAFFQAQPFFVASSADADGRVWVTVIEGDDGFIHSPNPRTLNISTHLDVQDPLSQSLQGGADIGVVGIELASRRRNRLSGKTRRTASGFAIDVRQSFGNCPNYINEREWSRVESPAQHAAVLSDHLNPDAIDRIRGADTLFIGSGRQGSPEAASNGYDASHRGGDPGFVHVVSPSRLRIPDYSGNNFFNTIGNLIEDPRVGLLFVDFASGGLLHVTGRAKIDWEPLEASDPSVLRMIEVEVEAVIDRGEALSLRWDSAPTPAIDLVVTNKVVEAEGITSFHLAPKDGGAPTPFLAGQHLPIALDVPGHVKTVQRSYSLSGRSDVADYRISVKREPKGVASQFLHDTVQIGDVFKAKPPSGDFVIPNDDSPLVFVSVGVGVTPMLAMLHQVAADTSDREVWFIHGARNGRSHILADEIDHLISKSPKATKRIFYSAPDDTDHIHDNFDAMGRMNVADILALKAGGDAQYMLCGPMRFMADLKRGLETAGVAADQIHFEVFSSANAKSPSKEAS